MAPKKDPKKAQQAPELTSLYAKREPLPVREPPDVQPLEEAWREHIDRFATPLPIFDAAAVNVTEWHPKEVEHLYANDAFAASLMPGGFVSSIATWKRAGAIADNTAPEEPAPESKPKSQQEPEKPVVEPPAPKAKPKAEKKGDKHHHVVGPGSTTAQQFAEIQNASDTCVVTVAEFRSRQFELVHDDAMPPLSQTIASQFHVVGDHRQLLPRGQFLWELIYPQSEEGMPLLNPHGKYIVKLFVHGQWRQVLIDDVVPVGLTNNQQSIHAPVLPSSASPHTIWPQLLTKALLRAFQHDLQAVGLSAVMALTGLVPHELPLEWPLVLEAYETRPFCCIRMSTKVDAEARQREALMMASAEVGKKEKSPGKGGAGIRGMSALTLGGQHRPQVPPRLGAQPSEAVLEFLVSELEQEPQQLRMKASMWRPAGGSVQKAILDTGDSEGGDYEEDLVRADFEDRASDNEERESQEEEERRSQRSSPAGEASARSKEEGASHDRDRARHEGQSAAAGEQSAGEGGEEAAKASPWPDALPPPSLPKSALAEHRAQLGGGGYWVGIEALTELAVSFVIYVPPGDYALDARLDTMWSVREAAFKPPPLSILRLSLSALTPEEVAEMTEFESMESSPRDPEGAGSESEVVPPPPEPEPVVPSGPPSHRATLAYEPLRLDISTPAGQNVEVSPSTTALSCLLQNVDHWQNFAQDPMQSTAAPEAITFDAADNGDGEGSRSKAHRSVLLPSGEHWYLIFDSALRAGSNLSVLVDGAKIGCSRSQVGFVEAVEFLQSKGLVVASVGTTHYPPQLGYSVWAKAELEVVPASGRDSLQLLSYVPDHVLMQHLRLTFLRLEVKGGTEPAEAPATSPSPAPGHGHGHAAAQRGSAAPPAPEMPVLTAAQLDAKRWSASTLLRAPLQPLMALPLGSTTPSSDDGVVVKYILMLESNVPEATLGGDFNLRVLLPPLAESREWRAESRAATPASPVPDKPPAAETQAPAESPAPSRTSPEAADSATPDEDAPKDLRLRDLRLDSVLRWGGEVVGNEQGLVMRERLTALPGAGDVTAVLRITVTGLQKLRIRAMLRLQLPPSPEMRPQSQGSEKEKEKEKESHKPDASAPTLHVDPKDYAGRKNWLASKRPVAEAVGIEKALIPHCILYEGATYLLDVFADPADLGATGDGAAPPDAARAEHGVEDAAASAAPEPAKWLLEVFGSSEVELGPDTMEQDLEALVRRSWEEAALASNPDLPSRKDRAYVSRKRWLKKHGLIVTTPEEDAADEAKLHVPAPAEEKHGKAAKKETGKKGANVPAPPVEEPVDPAKLEEEWLQEALQRAGKAPHANSEVDHFVNLHTEVEAMLTAEDPYTIDPVLDEHLATLEDEVSAGTREQAPAALRALGLRGAAAVRKDEIVASEDRWQQIHEEAEGAKERNKEALQQLEQWSEEHARAPTQHLELREMLRGGLQTRYQAKSTLEDLVGDSHKLDVAALQVAIEEAEKSNVSIWDKLLLEKADQKKTFLQDFDALRQRVGHLESEPLATEEDRQGFQQLMTSVKDLRRQLAKKAVPLPEEMAGEELLEQAATALKAANQGAEEGQADAS